MISNHKWERCNQLVCKCGYHTKAYSIYTGFGWGAFNEWLRKKSTYHDFWHGNGDLYRKNRTCPNCGEGFDISMKEVTGWNKFASEKQIKLLRSKGVESPETLIHEAIQHILS